MVYVSAEVAARDPEDTTLIDGVTKMTRADIGEKPTLDEQNETLRKIFTRCIPHGLRK